MGVLTIALIVAVLACLSVGTYARGQGWKKNVLIKGESHNDERVLQVSNLLALRGGAVNEMSSEGEFDSLLSMSNGKLVVVDFSASWCGPCKMIAPAFEELSHEYADSVFCKIDVDNVPAIAQRYEVMAMPTFLFIKNGAVVDRFSGASVEKLRDTIIGNL